MRTGLTFIFADEQSFEVRLLLVFFLRIALFAGLAIFLGFDTALVLAFFTFGFGLIAAGLGAENAGAAENGEGANNSGNRFHLTIFPFSAGTQPATGFVACSAHPDATQHQ